MKEVVPLIISLADLVAQLIKRANQEGALTEEQRQSLLTSANSIFEAALYAPPAPKAPDGPAA